MAHLPMRFSTSTGEWDTSTVFGDRAMSEDVRDGRDGFKINPEEWIIPFGKYSGEKLGDVVDADPCYVDWFVDAKALTDDQREIVKEICNCYRAEIQEALAKRTRERGESDDD